VVIVGGVLFLTIFYLSYIMVFILVLAVLFLIGYVWTHWDDINTWIDKD
jgi:hypothetical protein